MATSREVRDQADSAAVRQAERDHHDCIARYGAASVEAQAAAWIWRQLRAQAARNRPTNVKPAA